MTFKSLADEHAHFIASGYTETRWQLVLEHRRVWRLKHLNPWLEDLVNIQTPKSTNKQVSEQYKDHNTRIGVLEKMSEERPIISKKENDSAFRSYFQESQENQEG